LLSWAWRRRRSAPSWCPLISLGASLLLCLDRRHVADGKSKNCRSHRLEAVSRGAAVAVGLGNSRAVPTKEKRRCAYRSRFGSREQASIDAIHVHCAQRLVGEACGIRRWLQPTSVIGHAKKFGMLHCQRQQSPGRLRPAAGVGSGFEEGQAKNMAIVRRFALGLVRANKSKRSVKTRRKSVGWNPNYLLEPLQLK
jgi:hypothetical protein